MSKDLMKPLYTENINMLKTTIDLVHTKGLEHSQEYLDFLDEINRLSVSD